MLGRTPETRIGRAAKYGGTSVALGGLFLAWCGAMGWIGESGDADACNAAPTSVACHRYDRQIEEGIEVATTVAGSIAAVGVVSALSSGWLDRRRKTQETMMPIAAELNSELADLASGRITGREWLRQLPPPSHPDIVDRNGESSD
jgi:hypothetical protein